MTSNGETNDENVGNVGNQPQTATATQRATTSAWNQEERPASWLSYFWGPGTLLLASVPFCAGAYIGYRMPTEQLEDLLQEDSTRSSSSGKARAEAFSGTRSRQMVKGVDQDAIKIAATRVASKALLIATLGTVGTFGFLCAVGFKLSGYNSLEEAVAGTTRWASSWGKSLEHAMGGEQSPSKTHPEVLATKHMKEDEEMRYIYNKYIKGEESSEHDDDSDPQKGNDDLPTLYSIYEKYFKKDGNE